MATIVPLRPGKDAMSYAIASMRFTWLLLLLTLVGRASVHDFVVSTRAPTDTAAATTWLWPAPDTRERTGRLQIAGSNLAAPLRIDVRGVGPIGPGGSVPLNPGSYQISAAAAGYDSVRV